MEFNELVEHLDDLIDLARSERFDVLANELTITRWSLVNQREKASARSPALAAPIDPAKTITDETTTPRQATVNTRPNQPGTTRPADDRPATTNRQAGGRTAGSSVSRVDHKS